MVGKKFSKFSKKRTVSSLSSHALGTKATHAYVHQVICQQLAVRIFFIPAAKTLLTHREMTDMSISKYTALGSSTVRVCARGWGGGGES